ncbi:AAA family ATPase [Proteinivorax hydrogeniformans]|uniref:AAA family ATPase n=1 Tax=Proteinivorax hydrogeniformans TaxID=1826727 RepID=A0AAU8HVE4_9FIRM
MKIKKYSCTQFGGLRDIDIYLKDGLNVIVGLNEAGKSTVVEGIYSTLFKKHKLRRQGSDQEFTNRFTPQPNGDFFDGKVEIKLEDKCYSLEKSWGASSYSKMTLENNLVLQEPTSIEAELKKLLKFGEKTYGNIIFSKQKDLKDAISLILKEETTGDLSTILRRVVMELDGVSIDKLKKSINAEYDEIFGRWDIERWQPQNPNKRFQKGVGKLLEKYYQIEDLQEELNLSKALETEITEIRQKIQQLESEKTRLKGEVEKYSKIESDISKRALIEPKLERNKEQETKLKQIILKWPQQEEKLKNIEEKLTQIKADITLEEKQLLELNKLKEKENLGQIITKVKGNKNKLQELKEKLEEIPAITYEDVGLLESLLSKIQTCQTAIKAGKMQGKIISSQEPIKVTKDLEEEKELKPSQGFVAEGYLKISVGDCATIEIQSGEFNFQKLKSEISDSSKELTQKLESLNICSVEEGKLNLERIQQLVKQKENVENEINLLLAEKSYDEIKQRFESLKGINTNRSAVEIESSLTALRDKANQLAAEKISISERLDEWTQEYESDDKLFDKVAELKIELKALQSQVENLVPLPENFKTTDEFLKHITDLRANLDDCHTQIMQLKDKHYSLEKDMPDSSTEETTNVLKNTNDEFKRIEKRGRSLVKVLEVVNEQLKKIDENSFKPLADSFIKYLRAITLDNYNTGQIDNSFNIEIHKQGVPMPLELLSAGTQDCVALALRLAIIEVLYDGNSGFIVLDDCLVDLDPNRKEKAIELIKQFSIKNQFIFTTCNPQTGELLGGNKINLG